MPVEYGVTSLTGRCGNACDSAASGKTRATRARSLINGRSGLAYEFRVLLRVGADEIAQRLRRGRQRGEAESAKALAYVGLGERAVHFAVDRRHRARRSRLGHEPG